MSTMRHPHAPTEDYGDGSSFTRMNPMVARQRQQQPHHHQQQLSLPQPTAPVAAAADEDDGLFILAADSAHPSTLRNATQQNAQWRGSQRIISMEPPAAGQGAQQPQPRVVVSTSAAGENGGRSHRRLSKTWTELAVAQEQAHLQQQQAQLPGFAGSEHVQRRGWGAEAGSPSSPPVINGHNRSSSSSSGGGSGSRHSREASAAAFAASASRTYIARRTSP